jgi:spore coat polysaccharide biosynthesis protein SpsF
MTKRPHTIAIVQARMGSSRLPGKVLLDIHGRPMLARVVERTKRASLLDGVSVATTSEVQDDPIAAFCQESGYPCYRGSAQDVLDRYYQAARELEAEIIVRITADSPVIDPGLIDRTVEALLAAGVDFAANRLPPPWTRTFPIGLDVEACTMAALERAWKEADQPYQREHVMPYLYEGIPADALRSTRDAATVSRRGFGVLLVNHDPDYGSLRWAVDTPQDLELIRQVYARLGGRDDFSWTDLLAIFQQEPELARLNAGVVHKTAFDVDERQLTG